MDGSKIKALLGGALGMLCATGIAVAASAGSTDRGRAPMREAAVKPGGGAASRMLAAHNAERGRLRLPALKWNRKLESEAEQWARRLSRQGMLEHADGAANSGMGENLWMGSSGHWQVEAMVGMFLDEKRHFRRGAFPDISRTGNWADVGHYSQIVWRDTREVGCAVVAERGNDVLVCRYWPAGNVWGQEPY